MRRSRLILLGILLGLILLLFFAIRSRVEKSQSKQALMTSQPTASRVPTQVVPPTVAVTPPQWSQTEQRRRAAAIVQSIYSAPITFYGRVQDQSGAFVSDAKVEYGAIDKFWESGSTYQGKSDTRGFFSISGIKGAGLTVGVSKEGYDGIKGFSYQSFGYGMPPDSSRKAPPTKDNPALFILRRKAKAEALFAIDRDVTVPKDGTPVEVSLRTGKPVRTGQGDVKIECWTSDSMKDAQGRYQWRFRLSVPGGGLSKRTETEFSFEAPENGYEPSIEIAMPQASERWQHDHDGQYWLKLSNGTYARMRLRITTGGGHFASITSYLNPSGSRNLEYDENKVIK